jgi:hypothetical protein
MRKCRIDPALSLSFARRQKLGGDVPTDSATERAHYRLPLEPQTVGDNPRLAGIQTFLHWNMIGVSRVTCITPETTLFIKRDSIRAGKRIQIVTAALIRKLLRQRQQNSAMARSLDVLSNGNSTKDRSSSINIDADNSNSRVAMHQ